MDFNCFINLPKSQIFILLFAEVIDRDGHCLAHLLNFSLACIFCLSVNTQEKYWIITLINNLLLPILALLISKTKTYVYPAIFFVFILKKITIKMLIFNKLLNVKAFLGVEGMRH